jgi:hypothetical protein
MLKNVIAIRGDLPEKLVSRCNESPISDLVKIVMASGPLFFHFLIGGLDAEVLQVFFSSVRTAANVSQLTPFRKLETLRNCQGNNLEFSADVYKNVTA